MTSELRRPSGGLGRGLAALIPQRQDGRATLELPIDAIATNPYQPRRTMEQQALDQLAASIAEHGVLQPILVTETIDGYRLIAGERRLRAAAMAGLEHIPALVRGVEEEQQLALALIENLQREDLNCVEQAYAYRQLVEEFGLTQEEVARRVGRSRPAVTNTLRLLDLAPAVLRELESGSLTEGHGRAIAGLPDPAQQEELARLVVARGLSVRHAEDLVKRLREERAQTAPATRASVRQAPLSAELERIEAHLRTALGTKVSLAPGRRGGRITIEYYDDDDLGRIYERLTGEPA